MHRFRSLCVVSLLALAPVAAQSQDTLPPAGQAQPRQAPAAAPPAGDNQFRQQVSYALGRNFAMQLKESDVECDMQYLAAGIGDALSDAQPKWTDEQLDAVMQRFVQEMREKAASRMQSEAVKNQKEADQFLAQNAKREGVQSTPSGLQYRVISSGNGPSPTLGDTVKCNYRGTLLNGTEFDASAKRGGPATFPVDGVIPGWTEALQTMKVGDKWQLFIPPKLAYGMNPPGRPIEANSLLVFDIELVEIVK